MLKRCLFAALAAILAPGASLADTLVVAGGDNPRAAGPVWFAPPEGSAGKHVGLSADGAVLSAQRDGDRFVFLAPALAAGESKTFKIVLGEGEPAENVSVKEDAAGAAVTVGDKPFFHYNVKDVRKPNVFPLIGPSGASMTQSGPSDHIHHRSLWFTHGKVNGVDFWSESAKAGNGKHARFAKLVSGPVFGELVADTDWVAPDGRLVCSDRRTLRAWGTEGVRLLDFEIAIASATSDLTFGDDKEGTFGLRVAPSLAADQPKGSKAKGGKLINAEGKENAAVWGKPSPWCDYSGMVDGKEVGVAIFDSPTNFRHPTTWHARTYGLFAVNPFGLSYFSGIKDKAKQPNGSHVTPRGKQLVLRYRVYLHDGDAQAAKVAQHFTAFASPARAEAKR